MLRRGHCHHEQEISALTAQKRKKKTMATPAPRRVAESSVARAVYRLLNHLGNGQTSKQTPIAIVVPNIMHVCLLAPSPVATTTSQGACRSVCRLCVCSARTTGDVYRRYRTKICTLLRSCNLKRLQSDSLILSCPADEDGRQEMAIATPACSD